MEWLLCYKFNKTGFRHSKKHLLCLNPVLLNHPELHFIPIDQDPQNIICEGEKVVSALFCAYHLQYQNLNFSNNTIMFYWPMMVNTCGYLQSTCRADTDIAFQVSIQTLTVQSSYYTHTCSGMTNM
jgi:hypothetical protein